LVRLDGRPHLGQVDVHDVAKGVLREIGDADARVCALEPDPFMLGAVSKILRELHANPSSSDA
jgi:hypothetical protein